MGRPEGSVVEEIDTGRSAKLPVEQFGDDDVDHAAVLAYKFLERLDRE